MVPGHNRMTPEKDIFMYRDITVDSKVTMGNGALTEVMGKGSIGVETKKGRKHFQREVLAAKRGARSSRAAH